MPIFLKDIFISSQTESIKKVLRELQLEKFWAEIVGQQITIKCRIKKLLRGILYVSTSSPVWVHQMNFYKMFLLKNLNEKFGFNYVKDIRFVDEGQENEFRTEEISNGENGFTKVEITRPETDMIEKLVFQFKDLAQREKLKKLIIKNIINQKWREYLGWMKCQECEDLVEKTFDLGREKLCSVCFQKKNEKNLRQTYEKITPKIAREILSKNIADLSMK